ncbi:interleukin-12 receptor subunit beta-2 [Amia ocellicauda]|uniref:interleukin-12 receptor subunit beta-2 n=1 Tax=Amia ocellicauda TaxID=2972642 RepID=UPI003464D582
MPLILGYWFTIHIILLLHSSGASARYDCTVSTLNGTFVKLGTMVEVYCTIRNHCKKKAIYQDRAENYNLKKYNATTVSIKPNFTKPRTVFACQCNDVQSPEPCGLDIKAGYPPDVPHNLTCIQNGELGNITCMWKTGRRTYNIQTVSQLWVETESHGSRIKRGPYSGSTSVSFPPFGSKSQYWVWVTASNILGSASSPILNITLNNIVKPRPPNITLLNCLSWDCVLHWEDVSSTQLLEVQYQRDGSTFWRNHIFNATASKSFNCSNLQPFTTYMFRARTKLGPAKGLWSEWSNTAVNKTGEEVPLRPLDVWYIVDPPDSREKSFTLVWKKLSESEARGTVLHYDMVIEDQAEKKQEEYPANSSRSRPIFCSRCTVTLSARNSRGKSPPTTFSLPLTGAFSAPRNVTCRPHSNHSITITWEPPESTPLPLRGYVVEWFKAQKRNKSNISWKRLDRHQFSMVISENIQPCECYQGAVYALYDQGFGRANFVNAYSWQTVPRQGPKVTIKQLNNKSLTVTWREIPQEHVMGCITSYTIYLRNQSTGWQHKLGPIDATHRGYTINNLQSNTTYDLWMTASTSAGEGKQGESCRFTVNAEQAEGPLMPLWPTMLFASILVCLVAGYICGLSSVWQRLSCFTHADIPDPANSKWAKEYTSVKGQMKLVYQLYLNESTSSDDEPHMVEIEEVPEDPIDTHNTETQRNLLPPEQKEQSNESDSPRTPFMASRSRGLGPYKGQFTCQYIKTLSQESEISSQTQESFSTDMTLDYIPSNALLRGTSEEESSDFMEESFSSYPGSPFLDPVVRFGGKLTLDAVKIDCSAFME